MGLAFVGIHNRNRYRIDGIAVGGIHVNRSSQTVGCTLGGTVPVHRIRRQTVKNLCRDGLRTLVGTEQQVGS